MIVVVGGGAAGLCAAIVAAEGPEPVLLIERTARGGFKILISGGGRCNVLPDDVDPDRFVSEAPTRVVRGILRSWPVASQRAFFEQDVRVPLALEPATGKLFPVSNKARDVRDGLVQLAVSRGVRFRLSTTVTNLVPDGDGWMVETDTITARASSVILATGGLSVPNTGSDGLGLQIAELLGHTICRTYPALTPLTAVPPPHAHLSGVSLPVRIRARAGDHASEAEGGFLFTHRGYSGPAVLDVSHVAVRAAGDPSIKASMRVQWTEKGPDEWRQLLAETTGYLGPALSRHVPHRLAGQLLDESGIPETRRGSDLRREERERLIEKLTAYELPWTDHEGFRKAEVTGGGVSLDEVDGGTLESRRHPGLFFCGEMLDAFGPIGGHNFAWAWATARIAGRAAAARG